MRLLWQNLMRNSFLFWQQGPLCKQARDQIWQHQGRSRVKVKKERSQRQRRGRGVQALRGSVCRPGRWFLLSNDALNVALVPLCPPHPVTHTWAVQTTRACKIVRGTVMNRLYHNFDANCREDERTISRNEKGGVHLLVVPLLHAQALHPAAILLKESVEAIRPQRLNFTRIRRRHRDRSP